MVYVINSNYKALMPTTRYRHIKDLLKSGKAIKISSKPFIVKLLYETPDVTQPITLGIDPGRTNIGVCAVKNDGTPVFEAELVTRNREIPNLMRKRKLCREFHRRNSRRKVRIRRAIKYDTTTKKPCKEHKKVNSEKEIGILERILPGYEKPIKCVGIKNKEARFNNRVKKNGWLTPTANQLLQTHINLVLKLIRFIPISDIAIEVNKFSFTKMENPNVKYLDYGNGPLRGFDSLEEAVFANQNGLCIFCSNQIEDYHHIIPRSEGGSNTIENIVGLCKDHHRLVHNDKKAENKLKRIKAGKKKKYAALSVLNQIMQKLILSLSELKTVYLTSGEYTSKFRKKHNIDKTHNSDAYCIACSAIKNPVVINEHSNRFLLMQFRRHDRKVCNQEMLNRKYILKKEIVAVNRHKKFGQMEDSLEEYVKKGNSADCLIVKKHEKTYRQLDRIMPGAVALVNGKYKVISGAEGKHNEKPDYYRFTDGTRAPSRSCSIKALNSGIVFT